MLIFFDIRGIAHYTYVPPKQSTQHSTLIFHSIYGSAFVVKWVLHHNRAPSRTELVVKWLVDKKKNTRFGTLTLPDLAPLSISQVARNKVFFLESVSFGRNWRHA